MNSTILNWQLAGYNVIWWLLAVIVTWLLIWAIIRTMTPPEPTTRKPVYVADSVYDIPEHIWEHMRGGVVCIDVGRTLCKLGLIFRQRRLPKKAKCFLRDLNKNYGIHIMLVTRSNPHIADIYSDLQGHPNWIGHMTADKHKSDFSNKLLDHMRYRTMWSASVWAGDILIIGDRLTDMGTNTPNGDKLLGVLTNPRSQGGTDLIPEYFQFRRTRENATMRRHFDMTRAKPGEFRRV